MLNPRVYYCIADAGDAKNEFIIIWSAHQALWPNLQLNETFAHGIECAKNHHVTTQVASWSPQRKSNSDTGCNDRMMWFTFSLLVFNLYIKHEHESNRFQNSLLFSTLKFTFHFAWLGVEVKREYVVRDSWWGYALPNAEEMPIKFYSKWKEFSPLKLCRYM